MMQENRVNRITAWVALVATLFVLLFSAFYIGKHADHDCSGEHCPVCAVMHQCSNNLKIIGTAVLTVCIALCLGESFVELKQYRRDDFFCNSLIFQKVRMNN